MTITMSPDKPSLSIVVEWENAKLSELDRAKRMLSAVVSQAHDLAPRLDRAAEIIVLHDREEIDPGIIRTALDRADIDRAGLTIRIEAVDDLDYYAQKNAGAALATGDFVLFVDSDVVPDAGWLATLFSQAVTHAGSVVGGNTYLDPATFIGRTFGLFWFFPLRSRTGAIERVDNFFANSVIFPRELIRQRPFRPVGVVRGQCVALARTLRHEGIPIWRASGAQASHPAPNGIVHLVRRALCEGHDDVMLDRVLANRGNDRRSLKIAATRSVRGFLRRSATSARSIVSNRRAVDMPLYELPAALSLMIAYYGLFAVGEIVSFFHPTIIPDHLRV